MYKITINEQTPNKLDMVELLYHIAQLIESGCTSGENPTWNIELEINEDKKPAI